MAKKGGEILLTKNELQELSENILTKNQSDTLRELTDIQIDTNLPIQKRVDEFFTQVQNPYEFLVYGTRVTISFCNHNTTLNDCISRYLIEKNSSNNTIL